MKPTSLSIPADDSPLDLLIQRCVDHELTEPEERALLLKLDFQVDGWRQLALGFLEDRVMKQACRKLLGVSSQAVSLSSLSALSSQVVIQGGNTACQSNGTGKSVPSPSGLVAEPQGGQPTSFRAMPLASPTPQAPRSPVSMRRHWSTGVAQILCASLLMAIAFLAGRSGVWPSAPSIAQAPVPSTDLGASPSLRFPSPGNGLTGTSPAGGEIATVGHQPAMYVDVYMSESDQPIAVPVYSQEQAPAVWFPFQESILTESDLLELRRAGYQVASQRELVRVPVADGQDVLLPVEQYEVRMARY